MKRPDTIPEEYWLSMPDWIKAEVSFIDETFGMVLPTGSRYFCPADVDVNADWDIYFVSIGDTSPAMDLLERKFYHTTEKGRYRPDSPAISLYYSQINVRGQSEKFNVAVIFDAALAEATRAATQFCLDVGGPPEKAKRAKLFKEVCNESLGITMGGVYAPHEAQRPSRPAPVLRRHFRGEK